MPVGPALVSRAGRPEDFSLTLQLLHTLARSPDTTLAYEEVSDYEQVLDRIDEEVIHTYPYWRLRGLGPEEFRSCRPEATASGQPWVSEQFWSAVQRWVAALGDAHTAVIGPGVRRPPYRALMTDGGARLLSVPEGSAAYTAGVREGWTVDCGDPGHWLSTVGASPQHHAQVAARRFLEMTTPRRRFTARSPEGEQVSWTEAPQQPEPFVITEGPLIAISRFDGETPELFREALQTRPGEPEITVDLRGNAGGSLVAADQCRRMLLRETGVYGSLRYSDGCCGLSEPYPLRVEATDAGFCGQLRVLVDEMTYSAAEDFLQPLVGLDWVRLEGGPTGGGAGRPRTIPLMEGYTLRSAVPSPTQQPGTPSTSTGSGEVEPEVR
ncbi:S41 family peptidase [Nesterenkonia sp.]|uniref:S41 family peptidase n=1 Tax=Nesterenkonia sp. TaxID=704201 RepID=UPI00262DF78F|nr:S41 family peptidase [Nesterenkonia sp.]